jgi:hypothetical protein
MRKIQISKKHVDFDAFERILAEGVERYPPKTMTPDTLVFPINRNPSAIMPFTKFDYQNYLQQNPLKVSQRFHPLFEAVENAFNSIEECIRNGEGHGKGLVEITILRESKQPILNMDKSPMSPSGIIGFVVKDNGVGFRTKNWEAFEEVYTSYKRSFGGKGVGRLSYLLAFGKAEFVSCYLENDSRFERTFSLERTKEGTSNGVPKHSTETNQFTELKLLEFDSRFREGSKTLASIAKQLVVHFFKRFSAPSRIECMITDEWDGERHELGEYCKNEFLLHSLVKQAKAGNEPLKITHTKCRSQAVDKHQIMLCADGRVTSVHEIPSAYLPIKSKLHSGNNDYYYVGFVEGEILDKSCDNSRSGFSLEDKDDPDMLPGMAAQAKPSIETIIQAVGKSLKTYLKSDIAPLEADHRKRIEEFCRKNVVFKPLLTQKLDELLSLPKDLADGELEKSIWRVYQQWKNDIRGRFESMSKSVRDNNKAWEEYRDKYREALRELNQLSLHELAAYVTDRKAVIDFLWDRLKSNDNGRFKDENAIHDIFFPRNSTTNDIAWDESNLWLIDERMVFQQFAASDTTLRSHSKSKDRPDIASYYAREFDETFAFAEGDQPYCSVTLVEFKKPERTNYNEIENPYAQVIRYIRQIRTSGQLTKDGHTFRLDLHCPIHVHIICHIVDEVREYLAGVSYIESPDRQGIIAYADRLNAVINFTTFEKLIADARKRNAVFFNKLGLQQGF